MIVHILASCPVDRLLFRDAHRYAREVVAGREALRQPTHATIEPAYLAIELSTSGA